MTLHTLHDTPCFIDICGHSGIGVSQEEYDSLCLLGVGFGAHTIKETVEGFKGPLEEDGVATIIDSSSA